MHRLAAPLFRFAYFAALAAVTYLSLIPQPHIPGPEGSDKVAHLLAYGAIAFCGGMGFATLRARLLAALAAVAVGALLEFAQAAWFARSGSVWDAAANTAGAALGMIAAIFLAGVLERRGRD